MKRLRILWALAACLALTPHTALAGPEIMNPGPQSFGKLADAIYQAEGPRHPFGILSVKCNGYAACRRVCLRTIRNKYAAWKRAKARQPFLHYLAARYCPPSVDPLGHKRWIKNVTFFMNRRRAIDRSA